MSLGNLPPGGFPRPNPSVSLAFESSVAWTKRLLFPFIFSRWMIFAVCAWVASIAQGSATYNFNFSNKLGGPGIPQITGEQMKQYAAWVDARLVMFALSLVALWIVGMAFLALLFWLRSRGTFMFLDGVLTANPQIEESWSKTKRQGNSLCLYYLAVGLIQSVLSAAVMIPIVIKALALMREGTVLSDIYWPLATTAVIFAIPTILFGIAIAIANLFIHDFVVPVMYRRQQTFIPAASAFWILLKENLSSFLVYFICRIGISIGVGLIRFVLACICCCVSCLPVINVLPFLPLLAFVRSFPIFYLEQFGPEWEIFVRDPIPVPDSQFAPMPPSTHGI